MSEPLSLRGMISSALDHELDRLEIVIGRAWQFISVCCGAAGVAVFVVVEPGMGWPTLPVSALMFVWGTLYVRALRRPRHSRGWTVAAVVIENLCPQLIVAGVVIAIGPQRTFEQALFGPLVLLGAVNVMGVVRASWRLCLLGAGVAAVSFALLVFVVVPWVGPATEVDTWQFSTSLTWLRVGILLCLGPTAGFIAHRLRLVVTATVRRVRERDLFGKYRLETELASGGMGTVWRATYCPEGGFLRPAAVKRVHPHLAKDARFVDAFRKEAELGARLVHHNIVQTLDFGRVEDAQGATFFLAMELVEGCTCAELSRQAIARGAPLPPPIVARIVHGVLAGLAYAHEEARDADGAPLRVVHRDLAPQNVLVSKTGLVKITDFGIARTLRDQGAALTEAVGHKGHVAPEHLDGLPIDQRSDLFLVGVLTWELLCGRALFVRSNEVATLRALLLEPAPAPSRVEPALAPWDGFVARALEKDPAQRYASASVMAAAFEKVAAHTGLASADELGALVRSMAASTGADGATLRIGGGTVDTPSEEPTFATTAR